MKFINTPISDLLVIEPTVFNDPRGYFFESYSKKMFSDNGITCEFVQDNQSLSCKDVLRGLHFQNPPHAQAKLVRVIKGAVLDVAVDIRKNSATYGQHFITELNETNKKMIYIPVGFAHGFLTLANDTIFSYKCSAIYNKASEDCILWNDVTLSINWGTKHPLVSEKDKMGKPFQGFNSLF